MQGKRKLILAIVLLLVFALPTTVFAQGTDNGDQLVFGGKYRLDSGDSLPGDLFVFGGSAEVEEDAVVEGNLMQVGGSVDLAGEILGSLVVFGGRLDAADTAIIHGDFSRVGGNVDMASGAQVLGEELDTDSFSGVLRFPFVLGSETFFPDQIDPDIFKFSESFGPFGGVFPRFSANDFIEQSYQVEPPGLFGASGPLQEFLWILLQAFFYAILAVLVVLFLQRPTERVRRAAVVQPFLAGGLGIITMVLAVPILILLAITIILIPVSFSLVIVLMALGIFGLIAVGMEVGNRLGHMFNRDWHPALAAGIGVLTLSLAEAALGQVPCIGFLANVLVASIGLGAVWLTRFGTREYQIESDLPVEVE